MRDVAALEAQIAFVEDTVQALDEALAAQQQHILRLERAGTVLLGQPWP